MPIILSPVRRFVGVCRAATLATAFGGLLMGVVALSGRAAAEGVVTVAKVGPETRQVRARYAIDAPPAFVWAAMTSYPQLPSFVPTYRRCKVVTNEGSQKTLDIHMQASRMLPLFRYRVRVQENLKAMILRLQRISGDFNAFNGEYRLTPLDNGARTTLSYTLTIDPGIPIPGASGMIKSNVERELDALSAHAEQTHRKSLIGATN